MTGLELFAFGGLGSLATFAVLFLIPPLTYLSYASESHLSRMNWMGIGFLGVVFVGVGGVMAIALTEGDAARDPIITGITWSAGGKALASAVSDALPKNSR